MPFTSSVLPSLSLSESGMKTYEGKEGKEEDVALPSNSLVRRDGGAFIRIMQSKSRPKFDEIATSLLFGSGSGGGKGGGGGGGSGSVYYHHQQKQHTLSSSSSSSSSSVPSSSSPTLLEPPKVILTQTFLDLGQYSFDSHTCLECGMAYCPGLQEDVGAHERHCAKYAAAKRTSYVSFNVDRFPNKNNILWTGHLLLPSSTSSSISNINNTGAVAAATSYIVCIQSSELVTNGGELRALTGKIQELTDLLENELGSESSPKPLLHSEGKVSRLFMVENGKVIGIVVTEPIFEAKLLKRASDDDKTETLENKTMELTETIENESTETTDGFLHSSLSPSMSSKASVSVNISNARVSETTVKVSLGIAQIWVHQCHRRRGIATRLLDSARTCTVFAYQFAKSEVAFSAPTSGGLALATTYLQTVRVPIY